MKERFWEAAGIDRVASEARNVFGMLPMWPGRRMCAVNLG